MEADLTVDQDREGTLAICFRIDTLALDRDVRTENQLLPNRDVDRHVERLSRQAAATELRVKEVVVSHVCYGFFLQHASPPQGPRSVARTY